MSFTEVNSTPVSFGTYRVQHGSEFGPGSLAAEHQRLTQYRAAAAEDMAHKAVRLEPEEFLTAFLRHPTENQRPRWDNNVFKHLEDADKLLEAEVANKFIAAVNALNLSPGFKMAESQNKPDMGEASKQKIDASFFRDDCVPTDNRPNWADQMVSVEFKRHDTSKDPFDDKIEEKVDADAITRKAVRGQIITYAENVFKYQHRTALYMLLIIGRNFRFLRWDRSGAIVTRAVDYFERPDLLCEMLWHMAQLTDEQLGADPNAVRIHHSDPDYKRMDEAGLPNAGDIDHMERYIDELPRDGHVLRYVRDAFRGSLDPMWPRYRLDVPDKKETRSFLVAKPAFCAPGMAGRGTRGYVALDCQSGRFVWLKDAWRAHYELVDQEGSVLETLNKEGVRHVPTLVCHGDLHGQFTKTPEHWKDQKRHKSSEPALTSSPPSITPPSPSSKLPKATLAPPTYSSSRTLAEQTQPTSKGTKRSISEVENDENTTSREECPLRRHQHYRLVVEEVAMDLKAFQTGKQLVAVIYDCVKAHSEAMTKANIVHRDISGGNILIFPKAMRLSRNGRLAVRWTGLLADWELSKPIYEASLSRARQPERTGTWQYMSVGALSDHSKVIETADELESFFHVLLYNAVRYLNSNCTNAGAFIESFFDMYTIRDDHYICGSKKSSTMQEHGEIRLDGSNVRLRFDSPLDNFFDETLKWFKAHYKVQAHRASLAPPPTPKAKAVTSPPLLSAPPLPLASLSVFESDDFGEWDDRDEVVAKLPPAAGALRAAPKPTQEEEEDALKVSNHNHMLCLLVQMRKAQWVGDHVKDDNVKSYVPQGRVGPARCASAAIAKKRRTMPVAAQTTDALFPYRRSKPGANPKTPPRPNDVAVFNAWATDKL